MIKIALRQDDMSAQFIISGHAGYADPGHDIVCAAVSTVTHLLASMAEAWRTDIPTMHNLVSADDDDSGPVHIMINSGGDKVVNACVDCIIDAYQQIAEQYPERVAIQWIE